MSAIWVDADACPIVIREILYKAARRAEVVTTFVANHHLTLPKSPFIRFQPVSSGFDVADNWIVQHIQAGDLLISGDIPLADEAISKKAEVLNTRGERLTKENIKSRLNIRDFMDTLRSSGIQSGGPSALGAKERQAFANALDRWLARR